MHYYKEYPWNLSAFVLLDTSKMGNLMTTVYCQTWLYLLSTGFTRLGIRNKTVIKQQVNHFHQNPTPISLTCYGSILLQLDFSMSEPESLYGYHLRSSDFCIWLVWTQSPRVTIHKALAQNPKKGHHFPASVVSWLCHLTLDWEVFQHWSFFTGPEVLWRTRLTMRISYDGQ